MGIVVLHKLLVPNIVELNGLVFGAANHPWLSRMEMHIVNNSLVRVKLCPDLLGFDIPEDKFLILASRTNHSGVLVESSRSDPVLVSGI
jgi:hypothetical protein